MSLRVLIDLTSVLFFSGTRLLCFRESSFTSALSAWALLLLGWMPGRNRLEQGPFILVYEFPRFGPQPPPLLGTCCERCSDGVVHESIVGKQTEGRRSGVETLPSLPLLELGYICSVQHLQKSVTRWRPSTQHTSLFIVTFFAEAVLPCALWDTKYEPFISGISAAQCLFLWSANIGLITALLCCCLWWSRRCGQCSVVLITWLSASCPGCAGSSVCTGWGVVAWPVGQSSYLLWADRGRCCVLEESPRVSSWVTCVFNKIAPGTTFGLLLVHGKAS